MYKVFINDRPLILTDQHPDLMQEEVVLYMRFDSNETLRDAIDALKNDAIVSKVIIWHPDLEKLWTTFCSNYRLIEAAGGVVRASDGSTLFIFRNGKWDLPKGKLDAGETPEVAAVREVQEETGLDQASIIGTLPSTYHTYENGGGEVLKRTHWYTMDTNGGALTPQNEEGITEAVWLPKSDQGKVLDNTFNSLKELLQQVR